MGENDRARITLLTNGAAAHLSRANTLAQVEWNVTLLFWGALVTSGISFCAYASNSSPPLATYIARYDWVVLSAYMAASLVFLFGFSINQARSIVEVRSQYQRALNEAHRIASLEPIAKTGNSFPSERPDLSYRSMTQSNVWKGKLLSTFLFTSAIWIVTQVLAHGRIGLAQSLKPDQIVLRCAFLDCGADNRVDRGDWPEWGTWLWIGLAASVIWAMLRGMKTDNR